MSFPFGIHVYDLGVYEVEGVVSSRIRCEYSRAG